MEKIKEQLEQTQEEYQLLHEKIVQFEMENGAACGQLSIIVETE